MMQIDEKIGHDIQEHIIHIQKKTIGKETQKTEELRDMII